MKPQEFILEDEILDEWSAMDPDITSELKRKGYQFLGQGVDQVAFSEPDTGLVLKIFGTQKGTGQHGDKVIFSNDQKMFFKWAEFCMKNQNNPFLPKFYGFESFIFKEQTYLQIRQERLQFIGNLGWEIAHLTNSVTEVDVQTMSKKDAINSIIGVRPRTFEELKSKVGENKLLELLATIFELYKLTKQHGYEWDLHGANYMMRNDGTPVIVDPWVVNKQSAKPSA